MCGLTGTIRWDLRRDLCEKYVNESGRAQAHRGPDGSGTWFTDSGRATLGLAHQRLAIIDLNHASDQPMVIDYDESVIVFNGEIYNYLELRNELSAEGVRFGTKSDTEVLGKAVAHWGLHKAVNKFNGMWAFALYQPRTRKLILCRDRMGVKPLYYVTDDTGIHFSSEIKAILSGLGRKFSINSQLLSDYVLSGVFESTNETFFKGINKIPPGTVAHVHLDEAVPNLRFERFWQIGVEPERDYLLPDYVDAVREIFSDAVKIRLRSDVPVGVLLSGGVDSSAIACVANRITAAGESLTFLSATSEGSAYDESRFIDKVAKYTGRNAIKVNLQIDPSNAFDLLSRCIWHNDEPVASFSNVAHFLLMEKAKEHGVTVVLSGQGADEIFCGYKKYLGFYIQQLIRSGRFLQAAGVLLSFARNGTVLNQFSIAEAKRYIPFLSRGGASDVRGQALRHHAKPFVGLGRGATVQVRQRDDVERFSVPPLTHYEDRMSMAFGREIRLPFLDYRLAELAVSAPPSLKMANGWTKYLLRKAVENVCPPEIVWRKDKQGFINPESEWLRTSLKSDVMAHFGDDSLMSKMDLIDARYLRDKYEAYCLQPAGKGSVWFKEIFAPLSLELWLRNYGEYLV